MMPHVLKNVFKLNASAITNIALAFFFAAHHSYVLPSNDRTIFSNYVVKQNLLIKIPKFSLNMSSLLYCVSFNLEIFLGQIRQVKHT